jgi:ubiquinone/menaquinone biosynthesis C-methylase UbiE
VRENNRDTMSSYVANLSQVAQQYRNASNLSARQRIYKYVSPGQSWFDWVFDQLNLPGRARIPELGCGNAELWKANLKRLPRAWTITLSDASDGMVDTARQALNGHASQFSFNRFDAQSIPFEKAKFDAVIANHMLYHLPDRDRALAEVRRVLHEGGAFLPQLTVRNIWPSYES